MQSAPPGVMATLVHPTTGLHIHVVGTSHLSASYGATGQGLIGALRPDTVVLELDKVGLHPACIASVVLLVQYSLKTSSK